MHAFAGLDINPNINPNDEFQLLREIGKGSYGSVYQALWKRTGSTVAVKKIQLEEDSEEDFDDVICEVRILSECDNETIIKYHGAFFSAADNELWIVMELCSFGAITSLMQRADRGLTEAECAYVIKGVLNGLNYLHHRKIIHRDIKGNNILISGDGDVKLADFGVSAQIIATVMGKSTTIGTPYWMSPEVIQGKTYNYSADIWSVGITAIELVERLPPLSDVHPMRAMFRIPMSPPPELKDKEAYSPEFSDFIAQCLQKNPAERPSAAQLLEHPWMRSVVGNQLRGLIEEQEMKTIEHGDDAAGGEDGDGTGAGQGRSGEDGANGGIDRRFMYTAGSVTSNSLGSVGFDTALHQGRGVPDDHGFETSVFFGKGTSDTVVSSSKFTEDCDWADDDDDEEYDSGTVVRPKRQIESSTVSRDDKPREGTVISDSERYVPPYMQAVQQGHQSDSSSKTVSYESMSTTDILTKLASLEQEIQRLSTERDALKKEYARRG